MNKSAIVKLIYDDGRNVSTWARMRGHRPETVHAILSGRIPQTSYAYRAVMADLKKDGYWPVDEGKAA